MNPLPPISHDKPEAQVIRDRIQKALDDSGAMTLCPLMSNQTVDNRWVHCLQEQCGFWDWKEKQCAMVSIAIGSMEHIREKERGQEK